MKAHYIATCSKKSLPEIRAFVESELQALRVKQVMAHQLVLAVDEACANSIIHQHACDGKSRIKVSIARHQDELIIELTDHGSPFPITDYRPEDLQDIIRNRTKGGLGIFLITKIMDKIELVESQGHFVYRFVKYL